MQALADRAGISPGHVNNIEKGRHLPEDPEVIAGLARALGVHPREVGDRIRLERAGGVEGFRRMADLLAREGEIPAPASKVVAIKAHGLSVSATAQAEPRLLRLPFPGEVGAFRSIIRATSKRSPHAHSGAEAARSLCRRSPASV